MERLSENGLEARLQRHEWQRPTPEQNAEWALVIQSGQAAKQELRAWSSNEESVVSNIEGYPDRDELAAQLQEKVEAGQEARQEMWLANSRLVPFFLDPAIIRNKTSRKVRHLKRFVEDGLALHPMLELADILQWGQEALLKAIDNFDPTKATFATLYYYYARQAVQRGFIREGRTISLPKHGLTMSAYNHNFEGGWSEELEQLDTWCHTGTTAIEQRPDIESVGWDDYYERHLPAEDLALVPNADEPDNGWFDFGETDHLEYRATSPQIEQALAQEDERSQGIIRKRFGFETGFPSTLEEAGIGLGITREYVRQLQNKTLARVTEYLGRWPLRTVELQHDTAHDEESELLPGELDIRALDLPAWSLSPNRMTISYQDGFTRFIQKMRVYRWQMLEQDQRPSLKDFLRSENVSYNPNLLTAIVNVSDLIGRQPHTRGLRNARIAYGSVTSQGAQAILRDYMLRSGYKGLNIDAVVEAKVKHQPRGVVEQEKIPAVNRLQKKALALGEFILQKGLKLIDPVTGIVIDPKQLDFKE